MQSFHSPVEVAENHEVRSSYIRQLLCRPQSFEHSGTQSKIPKILVQFWHDLEEVPKDVAECLDTWSDLEQNGFQRVLFDDEEGHEFISRVFGARHAFAFRSCPHPAMRCDYFRLCYLLAEGGFYLDADEAHQGADCHHLLEDDTLKVQPLCYDTGTDTMVSPSTFLNKREYSEDWIFYVNNNPIISPPNHPILRLALERATRLLLSPETDRTDIQSTTGPGNLTASLVRHSVACEAQEELGRFTIIANWEEISISRWPLSYRNDQRNWRNWTNE